MLSSRTLSLAAKSAQLELPQKAWKPVPDAPSPRPTCHFTVRFSSLHRRTLHVFDEPAVYTPPVDFAL